jgi:hypothetical protein
VTKYETAIREAGIPLSNHGGLWPMQYDYTSLLLDMLNAGGKREDVTKFDRRTFCQQYSFAIPSEAALALIAQHAPILEVGAGTGYWAHELSQRGVDIVATDVVVSSEADEHPHYGFNKQWHLVLEMPGVEAVARFTDRTLLLIWPSYFDKWAAEVLAAFPGDTLIYIGESEGGCCADEDFFRLLDNHWEEKETLDLPQWFGIHDYLTLYQRKAVTPP